MVGSDDSFPFGALCLFSGAKWLFSFREGTSCFLRFFWINHVFFFFLTHRNGSNPVDTPEVPWLVSIRKETHLQLLVNLSSRDGGYNSPSLSYTLQGINISHLGKRKIIFKMPFLGDMLVSWRVHSLKPTVRLENPWLEEKNILLGWPIFRCCVTFRECTSLEI